MSLKISKNNTIPYNYFSENTGINPILTQVILDNTGGIKGSDVVTTFLVATTFNYTGIVVTPINEETGINWRVSLDNIIWSEFVNVSDMDALQSDKITSIYFAAVVANDGSVITGNYIQCKARIIATENP